MSELFTVILDYDGGTYIAQVRAATPLAALIVWEKQLTDEDLSTWKIERRDIHSLLNDEPIALKGVENIWCATTTSSVGLLLVNIVATVPNR
jgi:hypothetical protein